MHWDQLTDFVKTMLNLQVTCEAGNLLRTSASISISKTIRLRGVFGVLIVIGVDSVIAVVDVGTVVVPIAKSDC